MKNNEITCNCEASKRDKKKNCKHRMSLILLLSIRVRNLENLSKAEITKCKKAFENFDTDDCEEKITQLLSTFEKRKEEEAQKKKKKKQPGAEEKKRQKEEEKKQRKKEAEEKKKQREKEKKEKNEQTTYIDANLVLHHIPTDQLYNSVNEAKEVMENVETEHNQNVWMAIKTKTAQFKCPNHERGERINSGELALLSYHLICYKTKEGTFLIKGQKRVYHKECGTELSHARQKRFTNVRVPSGYIEICPHLNKSAEDKAEFEKFLSGKNIYFRPQPNTTTPCTPEKEGLDTEAFREFLQKSAEKKRRPQRKDPLKSALDAFDDEIEGDPEIPGSCVDEFDSAFDLDDSFRDKDYEPTKDNKPSSSEPSSNL